MNDVLIVKNKLYRLKWDRKKKKYIRSRVAANEIFTVLREICDIAKGTTLRDIFKMVDSYPSLKNFIKQYSLCRDITAFHKHAYLKPNKNKFVELVISAHFYHLNIVPDIHALEKEDSYGLEFLPMEEISNKPIRVEKKTYVDQLDAQYKTIAKIDGEHEFTLLEILDSIYWFISFYGGPCDLKKE